MKSDKFNISQDIFGAESYKLARVGTLWSVLFISFIWCLLTACMCNHYGEVTLLGTSFGIIAGWYFFLKGERTRLVARVLSITAIAIITTLFIKNIADILWCGHSPLMRDL